MSEPVEPVLDTPVDMDMETAQADQMIDLEDDRNIKIIAYVHPDANLKRPSNAYLHFSSAKRAEVKADIEAGKIEGTVTSALSNLWKSMSEEEKSPYHAIVQQEHVAYNRRLQELGIPAHARVISKTLAHGKLFELVEDIEDPHEPSLSTTSFKKASAAHAATHLEIPLTRAKAMSQCLPHVSSLTTETANVVTKAAECFAQWLSKLAYASAHARGKRTIMLEDVTRTIKCTESTQFLRPIIHNNGAGSGRDASGNIGLGEVFPDFDLTAEELGEREATVALGIPPGITSVVIDGDAVRSVVPYLTSTGDIDVSGINNAFAAAPAKPGKTISQPSRAPKVMSDEQKAAVQAKRQETLARKKAEKLAALAAAEAAAAAADMATAQAGQPANMEDQSMNMEDPGIPVSSFANEPTIKSFKIGNIDFFPGDPRDLARCDSGVYETIQGVPYELKNGKVYEYGCVPAWSKRDVEDDEDEELDQDTPV